MRILIKIMSYRRSAPGIRDQSSSWRTSDISRSASLINRWQGTSESSYLSDVAYSRLLLLLGQIFPRFSSGLEAIFAQPRAKGRENTSLACRESWR